MLTLACLTELRETKSVQNITLISLEEIEPIMCKPNIRRIFPEPRFYFFLYVEGFTEDSEMERDAKEPDNNEPSILWSGSDASQEHCVSESFADSYYEDDASDAEYRLDPVHMEPEVKSPELYQNEEWKPTGEQQQPPGFNGSEEEVSYQGEDEEDFFLSDSRESLPHVHTSPPVSPRLQRPDSEHKAGKVSLTRSSSLSTDGAADVTLALTPTRGQPQKASNRRCPGTLNMGVDSSEEGGSHEAPPASVFFGMPDEGAEPAETWNSESDTDLCRPDTQGLRNTRKYLPPASIHRFQQAVNAKT